jgi:hypothetical protein
VQPGAGWIKNGSEGLGGPESLISGVPYGRISGGEGRIGKACPSAVFLNCASHQDRRAPSQKVTVDIEVSRPAPHRINGIHHGVPKRGSGIETVLLDEGSHTRGEER